VEIQTGDAGIGVGRIPMTLLLCYLGIKIVADHFLSLSCTEVVPRILVVSVNLGLAVGIPPGAKSLPSHRSRSKGRKQGGLPR
jgi:hypothetical protein